ncbi:hypothetical protein [Jiella sp. M17.18]|uniref:hypothetical protein n=1 Tax=Jiella sp. M17.18 TaxID=3234247 RepID=UPI0034E00763
MPKAARVAVVLAVVLAAASPARAADEKVNVVQYALSHPTDNSHLRSPPQLGDSVPQSVKLVQPEGSHAFAYFYYAGQPIIVDVKTRSIVRIGG